MDSEADSRMAVDSTLVRALRDRMQADGGEPVVLIETHISWVLLTRQLAYKLKKPVRLPFVDFSTLAARRQSCEEEVRLNRRFAPALYLGVASVCGTTEAPCIGDGEAIDYAVLMRRFPDGALLQELLLGGRLEVAQLDGFARRLAELHAEAPAAAPLSGFGEPEQIDRTVEAVLSELRIADGERRFDDLFDWVDEQSKALRTAWFARLRGGAVRECHGDLHLANVVLVGDELVAFDCIEFDPALRWIDVLSDTAFLTMDLKAHGHGQFAHRFLDVYLQRTGDYGGLPVLRCYEVYRALVRALAGGLRARAGGIVSQPIDPDYLAVARQMAKGAAHGPRLLITHGLSGSGKSTVTGQLVEIAGAIRLRSDVERKRLHGLTALQSSAGQPVDIYTPEATRRTFARLIECARIALQAGYPVIVDAAFLRRAERQAFRALAAGLQVPFAILDCRASEAQLRRRVAARSARGGDASEANLDVLERQLAFLEPLDAGERAIALEVATDEAVDPMSLAARWISRHRAG